jgi:quercetin dioxygenase-like cupin family protein
MEYVNGNVFIREMRFGKAGEIVHGHEHNFDHTTYVAHGALMVEKLDANDEVVATVIKRAADGFNWVLIKAGVRHRITALEDGSIGHCIYSHRNPQGEVVVEWDGWTEAHR